MPLKATRDLIKYEVGVMDEFIPKRHPPSPPPRRRRLAPDYKWIPDNIPSGWFVPVTHPAADTGDLPSAPPPPGPSITELRRTSPSNRHRHPKVPTPAVLQTCNFSRWNSHVLVLAPGRCPSPGSRDRVFACPPALQWNRIADQLLKGHFADFNSSV